MTILTDNPDMWPTLLLLALLGVTAFGAMVAINKADKLKEDCADLRARLEAQMEIDRDLDKQLNSERSLRYNFEGIVTEMRCELKKAGDTIAVLKREKGDLNLQVMALCKDVESLRVFNGDMHRVIDMDANRLKEKDRIIAEQRGKIERLMKIRKR